MMSITVSADATAPFGTPTPLFKVPDEVRLHPAVYNDLDATADGKRFLMIRNVTPPRVFMRRRSRRR
jgi:hypothetical protein